MTLAEALAAVVARRPNAIAIQDSGHRVSYAMLWATVGELSESLARGGIGAGTIVAIRTPRGWQQIVAICAVLVAGASYLPVDPAYPPAVQDYMLVDSTATAVIELVDGQLTVSALDPAEPESPPPGTAYLLYTSGSTGS
ncbi:MAG: AMP-binding protein, partial [Jatrophihabitantaceae bacterium]